MPIVGTKVAAGDHAFSSLFDSECTVNWHWPLTC